MKSHKVLFQQVMALVRRILDTHEDGHRMEWGEDLFDWQLRRHGLPIGNLTSQFFANIHLDGFDHFVKQELGVKGYVRSWIGLSRMPTVGACGRQCWAAEYGGGIPREEKVRIVARAARGLLEQQ
jgi:hypothetical protein